MRIPGRRDCAGDWNFVGGAVYASGAVAACGDQGSREGDRDKYRDAHAGGAVLRVGGFGGRDVDADEGGVEGRGRGRGYRWAGAADSARIEAHSACGRVFDVDRFAVDLGKESARRGAGETCGDTRQRGPHCDEKGATVREISRQDVLL